MWPCDRQPCGALLPPSSSCVWWILVTASPRPCGVQSTVTFAVPALCARYSASHCLRAGHASSAPVTDWHVAMGQQDQNVPPADPFAGRVLTKIISLGHAPSMIQGLFLAKKVFARPNEPPSSLIWTRWTTLPRSTSACIRSSVACMRKTCVCGHESVSKSMCGLCACLCVCLRVCMYACV